jgi:hypothetical protein
MYIKTDKLRERPSLSVFLYRPFATMGSERICKGVFPMIHERSYRLDETGAGYRDIY